jgi:uncharacterized protein (DUF1684 family)
MKDKQFQHAPSSPLTDEQIPHFKKLAYFPIDYKYRINASFKHNPVPVMMNIQTSSGEERMYIKNGNLEFKVDGENYSLATYQDQDLIRKKGYEKHLFLPFTDKTTGKESYGGGRYLDIQLPAGNEVVLDFNLAYNPYCAYNVNYSCPIPPRENHLEVEIQAGEKKFK